MAGELAELVHELEDLKRQFANFARKGTVHEVKGNKLKLRVGGTEEEPFLSPWIPWAAPAGQFKHRQPPSKGQQMSLISPTGDLSQAFAVPLSFSKDEPAPDDSLDTDVYTVGKVKITKKGDLVEHQLEKGKVRMTPDDILHEFEDGSVRMTKDQIRVNFKGQIFTADKKGVRMENGAGRVALLKSGVVMLNG